jgi:hypothetical protein
VNLVLLTATAYFGAVFSAGFVLGVLRTLVMVPLLGELGAVLVEPSEWCLCQLVFSTTCPAAPHCTRSLARAGHLKA